jgi:hypothetical protein
LLCVQIEIMKGPRLNGMPSVDVDLPLCLLAHLEALSRHPFCFAVSI